jgi:hypothetical protein
VPEEGSVGEVPRATMDVTNRSLPDPIDAHVAMDSTGPSSRAPGCRRRRGYKNRTLPKHALGFVVGSGSTLPRHRRERRMRWFLGGASVASRVRPAMVAGELGIGRRWESRLDEGERGVEFIFLLPGSYFFLVSVPRFLAALSSVHFVPFSSVNFSTVRSARSTVLKNANHRKTCKKFNGLYANMYSHDN